MKDFLKAPISNLLGIVLCLVLAAAALTGSVGAPAQLAPLALTGGTSNVTGNLAVSGNATLGTGLTVTSGGETITAGGLTVSAGGLTLTAGTLSLPTASVISTTIGDITRTVNIPVTSFYGCTAAVYVVPVANGADTKPEFTVTTNQDIALVFGVTTQVDTDHVCASMTVPSDYVSGGAFMVRATKSADTGATEIINCSVSLNHAASLAAGQVTTSGAATGQYMCVPTTTAMAAEASAGLQLYITSGSTANDDVQVDSVAFEYVASE